MPHSHPKLILAGGSGFLGRPLVDWFDRLNWEVVVLSRQRFATVGVARTVAWDAVTLGEWRRELDEATAVINLTGRSVDCRYHARNRKLIWDSRIDSTRVLGEAIGRCARPPRVWLNSSTATIYKHSFDRPMDELSGIIGGSPEAKDIFSVEVAQAWEQAFNAAATPETRKVALRTAMVFDTAESTVYRVLRRLAGWGLGGAMAGGRQYVSWIHATDFCRAVEWLVAHDDFAGPVNLAAPWPLTNREMMRTVRQACGAPIGLPCSRWMLEIGALFLRTETELVIKSRRVVPGRLLAAGFEFRFADLTSCVADLQRRLAPHRPIGSTSEAGKKGSLVRASD